jgi:hypothetical protein
MQSPHPAHTPPLGVPVVLPWSPFLEGGHVPGTLLHCLAHPNLYNPGAGGLGFWCCLHFADEEPEA